MGAICSALLCCCSGPGDCPCLQSSFLLTWGATIKFKLTNGIQDFPFAGFVQNPSVVLAQSPIPCEWRGKVEYALNYPAIDGGNKLLVRIAFTLTYVPNVGFAHFNYPPAQTCAFTPDFVGLDNPGFLPTLLMDSESNAAGFQSQAINFPCPPGGSYVHVGGNPLAFSQMTSYGTVFKPAVDIANSFAPEFVTIS